MAHTDVKVLDLKPNQNLLDASFDGYKLSLETISKIKTPLHIPPHRILPSDEQYSSLHAQLFGLQNHLVRDPWASNIVYFADAGRYIQCIKYNEQTAKLDPLSAVYRLRECSRSSSDYNISFKFVSEKHCVLTDGQGVLHIIDTGDRVNKREWKSVYSGIALSESQQFSVEDARFEIINETRTIHCILLHIAYVDRSFVALLNLVKLTQEQNGLWSKTKVREIILKNLPTYCSLEPKSLAVVLCTDRPLNLTSTNGAKEGEISQSSNEPESGDQLLPFTWTQSDDDISIKFQLASVQQKNDFKLTSTDQSINITFRNESLLSGKLFGEIDADLTTWSMGSDSSDQQYIEVTLMKKDSSKWTSLLPASDDETTSYIVDSTVEGPKFGLTSVLQSEMEECDMDINDFDNDHSLLRIDTTVFKVTHKLNLGTNRPLFTLNQRPSALPAIVIRCDVDALIWVPKFSPTHPSDWSLNHDATLNAFGYVQASKQQKKYIQCSPDASYAVICESHRHVFVYKMTNSSAIGLKNRNGGNVSVGQQKLFSMEEHDEIVGISVGNEVTILLTEKHILVLQINA